MEDTDGPSLVAAPPGVTSVWVQYPAADGLDHSEACARARRAAASPLAPARPVEPGTRLRPGRGLQCYSRFRLREAFKMMGCKLQHADELTDRVFAALAGDVPAGTAEVLIPRDAFLVAVHRALLEQHYSSAETLAQ